MTLRLALGQLRAHAGRYLATVLAIAMAVAFVLASVGVLRTMHTSVESLFGARYAGTEVVVRGLGDRTSASSEEARDRIAAAEDRALDELRAAPGVRTLTVDSQTWVRMRPADGEQRLTTATALATDDQLRWQPLAAGRLPSAPGEIALRADGTVPLGATVEVGPTSEDQPTTATVVGLLDLAAQPDYKSAVPVFTTDQQVQSWATGGAGGEVRIAGDGTVDAEQLAAHTREVLAGIPDAGSTEVVTGTAAADALSERFLGHRDAFSRVLYAFVVLAVAVAALVIWTTFAVVFAARVRETALLRCLGAARWQIRLSAVLETLVVAALATALGIVAGRWGVGLIARHAGSLGVTVPLQEVRIPTSATWLAVAVGLGVTLVTAAGPIIRATSGSPLAALRPADVRPAPWWTRVLQAVAGLFVVAVCGPAMLGAVDHRSVVHAGAWGVGLFLGLVLLVAAALPTLLGVAGTAVGWVLGPIGLMGARNTARSPRRTASTATAVLVGVTLVATMVTGVALLRPAIEDRFGGRVPLDVAVTTPDGVLPGDLADRLRDTDGVQGVLVVTDMYLKDEQGRQTVLRVADPDAVNRILRRPGVLPGPGEVVLPSSSSVAPGAVDGDAERFTFFSDDDARELTVRRTEDQWALAAPGSVPSWPVAELPDGSPWPDGTEVPAEFTPRAELWLRMDDGLTGAALERALTQVRQTATADDPRIAVTEAFGSRAQIRSTVQAVLTSTALLLAVAVAIALLGVVNTLSLSVAERRRELGLLRGVGVTRGGLRVMIVFETLLTAAAAAAAGVVTGAFFGVEGARAVLGRAALGNISLPVRDLVGVGLAGIAAAALAAAVASVGAARSRVTEA